MNSTFLDVRYHQQDNDTFCGPAAAQIMLASIGRGTAVQNDLNRVISNGHSGMSPARLCLTLNRKKANFPMSFVVCYDTMISDAIKRIIETVLERGVAVPATVWGKDHWVVITGVALDDAGGKQDAMGFFIHDPLPETPTAPIGGINCRLANPHGPDDCCGHGFSFGSGNTYVALNAWRQHYWRQFYIDPFGEEPSGYVSITAETNPPPGDVRVASGSLVVPPPLSPSTPTIGKDKAKASADAGVARHHLSVRGPLVPFLSNAVAVSARAQHDPFIGAYYSVDLADRDSRLPAGQAFVDGNTGEFFGAQAPSAETPIPFDTKSFALSALAARAQESSNVALADALMKKKVSVRKDLVWKPCRQSMSPFSPFVQVRVGEAPVFVGADGRVHWQLEAHL